MELSVNLYLVLIALIAAGRLLELNHSKRNQQLLIAAGAQKADEPGYKWMVALHAGILAGCVLEVVVAQRPWIPALGWSALALFVAANAARWWVILTLGARWNVGVMSVSSMGAVTCAGPYRWVRHPNYTAVFVEMLALPLIHTAWMTALGGAVLHAFVLINRVSLEESVMMRDTAWRAAFESKPRFIP